MIVQILKLLLVAAQKNRFDICQLQRQLVLKQEPQRQLALEPQRLQKVLLQLVRKL